MTNKRLFFAAEMTAAWPATLPKGRLLAEEFRHMTLAFLGSVNQELMMSKMNDLPLPAWNVGPCGLLDRWMFLPEKTARVVAAHPLFLSGEELFLSYQKELSHYLFDQKLLKSSDPSFLPHASVSRDPFDRAKWMQLPCLIPFFIRGVALFKSLGHSSYELLWHKESLPPFQEIEHTADLAYIIYGKEFSDLALHAVLALAFSFPAFSKYIGSIPPCSSIQEIVTLLNKWTSEIDMQEGIGLKGISYHAAVEKKDLLQWTMIVDV
jgi:RNA 2',3'-cyclic 3'-phosphodiesterase